MNTYRRNRLLAITLVTAFLFMAVSPAVNAALPVPPGDMNVGPWVDKVVYKVIIGDDQVILALQGGVVDIHDGFFDPDQYALLDADPNLNVVDDVLRNGYGHIKINTRDPPGNWTAFRRAFAFAFDKTRVETEIFQGLMRKHDSIIVYTNDDFSIEDELPYHYYDADPDTGNALLDAAGFTRDWVTYPVEGWRTDPNGNPIHLVIGYSPSSPAIAGGCAQIGVDALETLHISAETNQEDFNTYIANLNNHGDYDLLFYATYWTTKTVGWIDRSYHSRYVNDYGLNVVNFVNESVDTAIENMLAAKDYAEAYQYCAEIQRLLHYQVPQIVTYENIYLQAYRNDKFTGHVKDYGRYLNGKWTMHKIRNLDGTFGGTVASALGQEPDTFNLWTSNSGYTQQILDLIYSSLYDPGPDLRKYPVLAESYIEERHADNIAVPEGHHRFTIDLIQNATWSDGTPFTAEDVAFTFTYLLESAALGNPAGAGLVAQELVSAYAPSTYRVVVEFGRESYFNQDQALYLTPIPKHIFEPGAGIGYEGWNTWNPMFNPEDPMVTLGPFLLTDMEAGEFYECTVNPRWAYLPEGRFAPPTTSPTTSGPTGPTTFDATLAIVAGAVGAAVVILVGGFVLLRQK
ncbi:MAG: ABC transporter substrate-binding protein [Candidatus Thorarchaeota archaeon]